MGIEYQWMMGSGIIPWDAHWKGAAKPDRTLSSDEGAKAKARRPAPMCHLGRNAGACAGVERQSMGTVQRTTQLCCV